jgi:hypothetical protein
MRSLNNILKILIINLLLIFLSIILISSIFSFLSNKFGGLPIYHNTLYQIPKHDLVNYFSNKKKFNKYEYLSVFSEKYPHEKYTGPYIVLRCANVESGKIDLVYKSDKFGFRENEDILYDETDYVFLGDSFIHGICVNTPNNTVEIFRKISGKKVLNLSLHGSQPWSQLAYAKKYLNNTNFKELVLFFFEGNDYEQPFKDNIENINNILLSNKKIYEYSYLFNLEQNVKFNKNEINEGSYNFSFSTFDKKLDYLTILKIKLSYLLRFPISIMKYFKDYESLLNKKDYEKIIMEFKSSVIKDDAKLSIVYLPHYTRLAMTKYHNHPQTNQFNEMRESIEKIASKNSIKFYDFSEVVEKRKNPLDIFYYELNTHYNELGNKILAEFLAKKLNYVNDR